VLIRQSFSKASDETSPAACVAALSGYLPGGRNDVSDGDLGSVNRGSLCVASLPTRIAVMF
jgi:hypothetical protein